MNLRTHPVVEYKGSISFSPSSINVATMKDFSMTVCIGAIPLKRVNYYMSNIKSRVTVKIDKNSEFINSPDAKESTFEVFAMAAILDCVTPPIFTVTHAWTKA